MKEMVKVLLFREMCHVLGRKLNILKEFITF